MTIRDPKFGVELSADELTAQDPCSVVYGVTPNNTFIPIKVDSQGRLLLGTGVTLSTDDIDIGDVVIKGVDPENSDAERRIAVEDLGSGNGFAVRTSIFYDSNQLSITSSGAAKVDGSSVTQPISAASLPLPSGASTSANQLTANTSLGSIDNKLTTLNAKDFASETTLALINAKISNNFGTNSNAIRTASQIGNSSGLASFGSGVTDSQTLRVVLPTDQPAIPVTDNNGSITVDGSVNINGASTSSVTSVNASVSNVLLLAANANRKTAIFFNDSTLDSLRLKLGSVASNTSFTVLIDAGGYYELPNPVYTGQIDGIWSGATGAVRITELS
jgi:uncharacterized membrane protein